MRRLLAVAVFVIIGTTAVTARPQSVSLGVGAGVAAMHRVDQPADVSFAWGFAVNIPVISTLHLSPSSEIYRDAGVYATDIALAFRFVVPLRTADLYVGVAPGLTASGTTTAPHVGALGGVVLPLISNVSWFAQYKYKVVFAGATNSRFSHANAGLLFSF
ncbi:MAG: hypothetical protein EA382_06595 [Spirochaetaceae bacterium]|nr:MAG: hypothetical protein EA382_06595 [Spirochaetaceae bacterium]